MNKIVRFHAALIMMCVVAFSVSLGSCDKNEVDSHDENSLSLKVDTNGVNFTLTPLINWKANLTDVEKYMAKYFPDFDVCDNGELEYDEDCGYWSLKYESHINMRVSFLLGNEQGDGLGMTSFKFASSCNVDKIREELSGLGFKFMGLVYTDVFPDELEYMYLSNDEKLEVQFIVYNCGDEDRWYLTFQPTDWNDLNYLIDTTNLCINVDLDEGSYSLIPFMDWNGTLTDVRNYMTENYPDWEAVDGGAMIIDTLDFDSIPHWYTLYKKDSLSVFYHFDDIEGLMFSSVQYACYGSTDLTQNRNELTRNGLKYIGHCTLDFQDQISNYIYVPLSKEYYVSASSWTLYEGVWTIDIVPYNEEFMELVSKD